MLGTDAGGLGSVWHQEPTSLHSLWGWNLLARSGATGLCSLVPGPPLEVSVGPRGAGLGCVTGPSQLWEPPHVRGQALGTKSGGHRKRLSTGKLSMAQVQACLWFRPWGRVGSGHTHHIQGGSSMVDGCDSMALSLLSGREMRWVQERRELKRDDFCIWVSETWGL